MSDWFDQLAAKKTKANGSKTSQAQQRNEFDQAAKVFLRQLHGCMLEYVQRYKGGHIDLRIEANTLEAVSHAHGTTALPNVSVTADSRTEGLVIVFPEAERFNVKLPMVRSGEAITFANPKITVVELCRFALTPVLFPEFLNDPEVAGYMNRKLGSG